MLTHAIIRPTVAEGRPEVSGVLGSRVVRRALSVKGFLGKGSEQVAEPRERMGESSRRFGQLCKKPSGVKSSIASEKFPLHADVQIRMSQLIRLVNVVLAETGPGAVGRFWKQSCTESWTDGSSPISF
jgi:hypothetical protein